MLLGSVDTGWSAITADRWTEWTYAAAMATATTLVTSTHTTLEANPSTDREPAATLPTPSDDPATQKPLIDE